MSDRSVDRQIVIAIDGPSGSGKSTVARGVATRWGLRYLDTGATYRALTWLAQDRGLPLTSDDELGRLCAELTWDVTADPADFGLRIGGQDPGLAIRGAAVSEGVSHVAALPAVRAHLVALARRVIGEGGIVVEGRDIATAVWPAAPVKVHLTADAGVRAARRAAQGHAGADISAVLSGMQRRDALDAGRAVDPLVVADGSHVLDATDQTPEQLIDQISTLISALPGPAGQASS